MELLHVALVDQPVQKYSVISPTGNDGDRFALIEFVVSALRSPWHGWSYHREERRRYHPAFMGIGRNDRCPCGSTRKYKVCCLNKEIVFPHFQLSFEEDPPIELPRLRIHTEGDQARGIDGLG